MISPRLLAITLLSLGLTSAAPIDEQESAQAVIAPALPPIESFLVARHSFLAARNDNQTGASNSSDPGFGPNHVLPPGFEKHLGPGPELMNRYHADQGAEGYSDSEAGDGHVFDPSIVHHFGPGPAIIHRQDEEYDGAEGYDGDEDYDGIGDYSGTESHDGAEGYDDSEAGDGHIFDPSIIDHLGPGPVVLGANGRPI